MTKQEKELLELEQQSLALSQGEKAPSFVRMDYVTLCNDRNKNLKDKEYKGLAVGNFYIASTKEVFKKLSVIPLAFIQCCQVIDEENNMPKGLMPEEYYHSLTDEVLGKHWIKETKEGFHVHLATLVPVHIVDYPYGEEGKATNTVLVLAKTSKKTATKWLSESKEIGDGDCAKQVWDLKALAQGSGNKSWLIPDAEFNAKATKAFSEDIEARLEVTKKSIEKRQQAKKEMDMLARSAQFAVTEDAGKDNSLDEEEELNF